mgnify:CR=1 FL=1
MISVIIPLYNKEKCIRKTIDSILNQKGFSDFEIVVVDDGSTDRSCRIVETISDNRVVLYHKKNGGVSAARNYGALLAKGDWITFLDADDLFYPDALSIFHNLISRYPDDELFVANFKWLCNGQLRMNSRCMEFISENPAKDIAIGRFYIRPGSFCISKRGYINSGGFDERLSFNEDREYGIRVSSLLRVVYSPKFVMEYITENSSASIKVHPLEKDFVFYFRNKNMSNWYVKYMYFKKIISSVNMKKKCGDDRSVKVLDELINSKFSLLFQVQAKLFDLFLFRLYKCLILSKRL